MQLTEIKAIKCPHCGSRTISEAQEMQHTNGHWFESRAFECGLKLRFVPNFMRIEEDGDCRKSPDYHKRETKRSKAMMVIRWRIGRLDVDDDFKNRLLHSVHYIGYAH